MGILKHPNRKLRLVCSPVKAIDARARKEAQQMLEALRSIDTSFTLVNGLASNQVGLGSRIVVMKLGFRFITMINPVIAASAVPCFSIEVCASLPGVVRLKRRKFFVKVDYLDLDGEKKAISLLWLASFTMQQEIDHLDGKLIID